jgi:hypothetical protein
MMPKQRIKMAFKMEEALSSVRTRSIAGRVLLRQATSSVAFMQLEELLIFLGNAVHFNLRLSPIKCWKVNCYRESLKFRMATQNVAHMLECGLHMDATQVGRPAADPAVSPSDSLSF